MRVFYKLKRALEFKDSKPTSCRLKVWAEDIPTKKKGTKRYLVGTVGDVHTRCVQKTHPHIYEVVQESQACGFYLDIERNVGRVSNAGSDETTDSHVKFFNSANAEPVDAGQIRLCINYIVNCLHIFLQRALPQIPIQKTDIKVLNSSTAKKLSIHLVCSSVVLIEHIVSCCALAHEFMLFFDNTVKKSMSKKVPNSPEWRAMALLVNIHPEPARCGSIVDMSVYKISQCFRLPGNSKIGGVSLVPKRREFPYISNPQHLVSYGETVANVHELEMFLINTDSILPEPIPIALGQSFPFPGVKARYFNLLREEDAMASSSRFCGVLRRPTRAESMVVPSGNSSSSVVKNSDILDDTYSLYDEHQQLTEFGQLTPGQYVYHPKCEVTKSGPVGIPSAHVFATKDGGLAFYCFNCCQTTFCMATWHMEKLAYFPDELINIKGHINEFAQDVILSVRPMALQVVDAPTGSGKTELLASFCRSNPDISILSITFRRSLSTMLSKRLGLNDYQSCNFESDPVKRRRLSICLDSVPRLPINERYDVVIIDEAGQVRYHFIGDTIAPKLDIVYRMIERILTNTKTTILMQFELLQTDLEFWASFAGIDVADRAACRRWVIESETFCPPMRYSESLEEVMYCLKKHYVFLSAAQAVLEDY